ncbi:WD repeat and SOCS box-containing protein 1 isoform X2 [Pungitius pungitius]|uniref:WD repeat and SOCS box-containing protein 1 isoform X2 n=1 Tax=Pungitius pungitius TaxID=134920 RepID=UPI002E0F4F9D
MASFPDSVNENDIGKAKFIGELLVPVAPFDQKSGREAWTVAFAPNGSYFAWSQGHRIVRLIPWAKCLRNFSIGHGGEATNALSPRHLSRQNSRDGQMIPEADEPREHTIDCGDVVWGLAFGSSVPEKQSRCVNIEWHRFKFGQDQLLLATGLSNGRIKIWDVYTGRLLLNLMDHTDIVRDLTFAPDGSLMLVSASRDKTLRVWDLKDDGNMVKVLRGHQNWVYCSAFSPDSSILCSVGAGKAVFLWNMDKLTLMRKLEGHHNDVVSCEFSPDGALLATASYDTRVIVWDPHKGTVLLELGHLFPRPSPIFAGGANDRWVRSVSFSPDGRHIASITDDRDGIHNSGNAYLSTEVTSSQRQGWFVSGASRRGLLRPSAPFPAASAVPSLPKEVSLLLGLVMVVCTSGSVLAVWPVCSTFVGCRCAV